MDRSNHYEAAFEAYLQWHRLCYVAVDETRRSMLGDSPVKSLDFIVHGDNGSHLLVDVKGRRFPVGLRHPRRVWECWTLEEDVDALERWSALFGPGFVGLFVFAYCLSRAVELPEDTTDLWTWRGRRYLLRAVDVATYRGHLRMRSPRWHTVSLPAAVFRQVVRPLTDFTHGPVLEPEACPF